MSQLKLPFFTCLLFCLCSQLTASLIRSDDRIVFIGDSITGQGGSGKHGWVARIDQGLKSVDAQNHQTLVPLGGSGQSVRSWLNVEKKSRDKSSFLDVKKYDVRAELDQHADIVVVMLGMNDVLSPSLLDKPERIEQWKEQYRSLITAVRERTTPRVFALATPTPCTEDPASPKNVVMDKLVVVLQALAAEENCIILPTREAAWQLLKAGRKLKPDFHFLSDQVHPNSAGHAIIASGMLQGLGEGAAADALFQEALARGGAGETGALSYTLKRLSSNSIESDTRFQLEVFHHDGAPEFDLPTGWELKASESGEAFSRYELIAQLNQRVNRMVIHSGGHLQSIEIPAPWLVGTANAGWHGWRQGVYDAEYGSWPADEFVRLGEGFEEGPKSLELKEAVPVMWKTFVGDVNYGGSGNPDVLDFAQVTYFSGGELGYGLRWIFSSSARPVEVAISQPGFSGNSHLQLWVNGSLVYGGNPKKAKGQSFESSLKPGWNLVSFKSNHQQWQWQLSVGLSGVDGDTLEDLRYAVRPGPSE